MATNAYATKSLFTTALFLTIVTCLIVVRGDAQETPTNNASQPAASPTDVSPTQESPSESPPIDWGRRIRSVAGNLSQYQFSIGSEPVTVQKVFFAVILFIIGIFLSRRFTAIFRRTLLSRPHIDPHYAAILEKLTYYALLVVVFLFALNTVNIPLTVFTFFGGALAIGVGFGAQTLINNFISGIILLLERPVKLGDIVEVDGERGKIVNIGVRCSQLRLPSGIDVFVPNSTFLERKVTNWTFDDRTTQLHVTVVVDRGASGDSVSRALLQATEEHDRILRQPPPGVLLEELGERAMKFAIYFWIELTDEMDSRAICSDVRFRIERLLAEAGLLPIRRHREEPASHDPPASPAG